MSKSVLIVEKDRALIAELRDALQNRGFEVDETTDGKGAPERIRQSQPGAVVLAVDLDAGQNGYIICKKLKSDDALKQFPVIIIGDPKGFAQHQKLKTRAEEYLGKPLTGDALAETLGKLIGFPETAPPPPPEEEAFDPGSLLEEEGAEVSFDEPVEEEASVEADLEMVDSLFEEQPPLELPQEEEEISLSSVDEIEEVANERTVVGFMPVDPTASARTSVVTHFSPPTSSPSTFDGGEAREFRAKVTELTSALDDARTRTDELESRVRELESELESKATDLAASRASSGRSDNKEVFALREAGTKKDKEILRLKNELNQKEQELVEFQEKQNSLEMARSEGEEETAKKDAQLETLHTRADALAGEKKKLEQQLSAAKEEARAASAMLSTLQSDFDALQARAPELESELESLRGAQQEAESARATMETELAEVRGELDALKTELEAAQADLDASRGQLTTQATTFADEISGLRQRLADAEAEARNAESLATRQQTRARAQQEQLERLRVTLQEALDGLGTLPGESAEEIDIDELAEA